MAPSQSGEITYRHRERSEVIQSHITALDGVVATLFAMTGVLPFFFRDDIA
jgi:hypothetical protein